MRWCCYDGAGAVMVLILMVVLMVLTIDGDAYEATDHVMSVVWMTVIAMMNNIGGLLIM